MPIYFITKMLCINIFNILTSDLGLQILRVFIFCIMPWGAEKSRMAVFPQPQARMQRCPA